ncbi:MAG: HIT domain-containing protein [Christensenellaceae bacterium]|jgi:hypothetical protein|nr:HIT domain-containing protein [Christensenellaceae bacterium]
MEDYFDINSPHFMELAKKQNLPADIIWQNENVYIQVDINPITVGHLLIIPKNNEFTAIHSYNKNESENEIKIKEKIKESVDEAIKYLSSLRGDDKEICFFEHGSMGETCRAGSCFGHAHLHALFFNRDKDKKYWDRPLNSVKINTALDMVCPYRKRKFIYSNMSDMDDYYERAIASRRKEQNDIGYIKYAFTFRDFQNRDEIFDEAEFGVDFPIESQTLQRAVAIALGVPYKNWKVAIQDGSNRELYLQTLEFIKERQKIFGLQNKNTSDTMEL